MTRFIRNKIDDTPIEDNVFSIVSLATKAKQELGADKVVDATIGALYDEGGSLVAFESVYKSYNAIENRVKAKYASSFSGNPSFKDAVYKWVTQGVTLNLFHKVIATPGGSGAVSTSIQVMCDVDQTILLPEIAWGSYKLMATMNNLQTQTYKLFDKDGFNVQDFKEKCLQLMHSQGKVFAIINDPCHNPTGYSLSKDEWKQVVDVLRECSALGPVILLNDIAYMDFAYDFKKSREYLELFNQINENILLIIAFSSSKTMTSYGLRCGAAIVLAKHEEATRQVEIVLEKEARAIWSNIPNAAMDNFVQVVTTYKDEYLKEKDFYVGLLKQRSDIFVAEAAAVGLIHYPYREGFFVTLKEEDDTFRKKLHQAYMDHQIYTVLVNKGIRVALCSLSVDKVKGLANKMYEIRKGLQ